MYTRRTVAGQIIQWPENQWWKADDLTQEHSSFVCRRSSTMLEKTAKGGFRNRGRCVGPDHSDHSLKMQSSVKSQARACHA